MVQILKLKPAFTDDQAQALAGLFDEDIATKRDVAQTEVTLRNDTERLRVELKSDIEKLRLEVQRDLKGVEARLIAWVVGQGLATVGLLFALMKFAVR